MRIYPSQEFWESSLETPVFSLLSDFKNQNIRKNWLHSLSGKQLSVVFYYCCKDKQNGQLFEHNIPWQYDDVSVQQKRKILINIYDALVDYYLVDRFGCTKSESAIVEVAKSVLHQDIIESLLLQNNKYDKKSLLFILFHDDPHLLKHVFHFNKVQKRSFSSFTLKNPPRQKSTSFRDFLSEEVLQKILKQHDLSENDSFKSQLQGLFYHQNRIYVFIRRASDFCFLLNSNQVVHGHKPDWMILDFSLTGTQVNLCAKNSSQVEKIANGIVSKYFECECVFVNMQEQNFAAQVYKFLQACIEGADTDICIFEIKFRSAYFRDSNTTHLTLTIKPYSPMALELDVLKSLIGSSMFCDISHVHSIRVMFHNKKVTLLFKSSGEYVTIYYLEHHLNKKEREELKTHMKQFYGLTILSKANC